MIVESCSLTRVPKTAAEKHSKNVSKLIRPAVRMTERDFGNIRADKCLTGRDVPDCSPCCLPYEAASIVLDLPLNLINTTFDAPTSAFDTSGPGFNTMTFACTHHGLFIKHHFRLLNISGHCAKCVNCSLSLNQWLARDIPNVWMALRIWHQWPWFQHDDVCLHTL